MVIKLLFFLWFLIGCSHGYITRDQGNGNIHILPAVKDTFLERNRAWDRASFGHLIIGHLRNYPVKRTLIQFENLPGSCPVHKIVWARMFLYFSYAHRASFRSVRSQPWLDYTMHVHRVKRSWEERTTTPYIRCRSCKNRNWYKPRLELGRDAEPEPECKKTVIRSGDLGGFKEFDITGSVKAWASGTPNYGLLMKVVRENLSGRGLRFWDRHNKNTKLRPFAQVLCKY